MLNLLRTLCLLMTSLTYRRLAYQAPFSFEDGGGVLATALSQAYGQINSGSYDVVYVDLAGDANSVDYIFYDNGASGVGVLDLGTSTTLSTTLGDDILI